MNPRAFLNVLLETVFMIQLVVNTQTPAGIDNQRKNAGGLGFGADDMLPIFLFVLINADLKSAVTACELMKYCTD